MHDLSLKVINVAKLECNVHSTGIGKNDGQHAT